MRISPGVARARAAEDLHQRGLARTVLAKQHVHFAARESKSTSESATTPGNRLQMPRISSSAGAEVVGEGDVNFQFSSSQFPASGSWFLVPVLGSRVSGGSVLGGPASDPGSRLGAENDEPRTGEPGTGNLRT